jgi:hypothetical protein
MMPHLLVATPAYGGLMNYTYVMSIINLERMCVAKNIRLEFYFVANESLIQRARNLCAHQFLSNQDATHLLFIDADIQFDPNDIMRMIEADVDLIGGIYAKKHINWDRINIDNIEQVRQSMKPLVDGASPPVDLSSIDEKGLAEAMWLATGCMLIKRNVFDTIRKSDDSRWITTYDKPVYAYFDCMLWNGNYLSEDFYFCQRWKDLGGKVYAATWVKTTHFGTFGFQNN